MSNKLKQCQAPGCTNVQKDAYCTRHQAFDTSDNRLNSHQRGYDRKWGRARARFLARNPYCSKCSTEQFPVEATQVDHIIPVRRYERAARTRGVSQGGKPGGSVGNVPDFWDETNWQGLCRTCHSIKTASEDGGFGNKGRWKRPPRKPRGDTIQGSREPVRKPWADD